MDAEERKIFDAYLRKRGQKITGPRKTVLDAFLNLESHVTAEEILKAARGIDPTIGQATVFRTIKLITGAGLASEACSDEGGRRFEHAYGHSHHDHMECLRCGRIIEFVSPDIETLQEKVCREHRFRPAKHRLTIQGICAECEGRGGGS